MHCRGLTAGGLIKKCAGKIKESVRGKIHWRGGSFAPVEPLRLGTIREVANALANASAGYIKVSPVNFSQC